jgi:hypothetical protein
MGSSLCKLSVIGPREIQTTLADLLDALPETVPGYTMIEAEGRGVDMSLATAGERVKGAMRAIQFMMILPRDAVPEVLATIAGRCPRRQITYWTEPVEDFGRLI